MVYQFLIWNKDIYNFIKGFYESAKGHTMVIVGYDDNDKTFTIANSWGNEWGDNGYFYMDYEFLRLISA